MTYFPVESSHISEPPNMKMELVWSYFLIRQFRNVHKSQTTNCSNPEAIDYHSIWRNHKKINIDMFQTSSHSYGERDLLELWWYRFSSKFVRELARWACWKIQIRKIDLSNAHHDGQCTTRSVESSSPNGFLLPLSLFPRACALDSRPSPPTLLYLGVWACL